MPPAGSPPGARGIQDNPFLDGNAKMTPKSPLPSRESNTLVWIVLVAAFVAFAVFGLSLRSIHSSVETTVGDAQSRYGGDAVAALMSLVTSEKATFQEKNRAIWALGQIGDRRALPLLQRLMTGEVQERPYHPDRYIVQYSVEKAINQIECKFSLTRWMYADLRTEIHPR